MTLLTPDGLGPTDGDKGTPPKGATAPPATDKAGIPPMPPMGFPQDPLALYRDLPQYPRDPREREFSFGPGLRPRGKERALPSEGGQYRGTTPRTGRVSPRDQAGPGYRAYPGHPGERIR